MPGPGCKLTSRLMLLLRCRTDDAVSRYLHEVRCNQNTQQLQLADDDNDEDPEDLESPALEVQCRALPVASIGKGRGREGLTHLCKPSSQIPGFKLRGCLVRPEARRSHFCAKARSGMERATIG